MSGLVFGLVLGMFFIVSGVSGVQKGVYVSERPDEGTGLYSPGGCVQGAGSEEKKVWEGVYVFQVTVSRLKWVEMG